MGARNGVGAIRCVRTAVVLFVVGAGVGLGGCGSSNSSANGLAGKPASVVLQATVKALESAASFHVTGRGSSGSATLAVSLQFFRNSDVEGTIVDVGTTIQIVVVGGYAYLKAPAAFWEHGNVPATVAKELNGRFAKIPSSATGSIDEFSYAKIAQQLSHPGAGTFTNDGLSKIDGQRVVNLIYTDGSQTGHLYVSSTGRPYPVEIDHLSGTGTVTLSNWDAGTLPTAPTNFVTVPS